MQINRDVCISVQNRVLRFENPELGKEKNIDTFLSFNHACLLIDTNRYNSGALMKKKERWISTPAHTPLTKSHDYIKSNISNTTEIIIDR